MKVMVQWASDFVQVHARRGNIHLGSHVLRHDSGVVLLPLHACVLRGEEYWTKGHHDQEDGTSRNLCKLIPCSQVLVVAQKETAACRCTAAQRTIFVRCVCLKSKCVVVQLTDLVFFIAILLVVIFAYGVASQALRFPNSPAEWSVLKGVVYLPYWQMYGELFLEDVEGECLPDRSAWPGEKAA